MIEYDDLKDPGYKTVKVEGVEPEFDSQFLPDDPINTAVSTFVFSGIGQDEAQRVKLNVQTTEFAQTGFNGVPPESVLLAMLEHYKGLQESNLRCNEFAMVVCQLTDIISVLKGRNDLRAYKGTYGTTNP